MCDQIPCENDKLSKSLIFMLSNFQLDEKDYHASRRQIVIEANSILSMLKNDQISTEKFLSLIDQKVIKILGMLSDESGIRLVDLLSFYVNNELFDSLVVNKINILYAYLI